MKLSDSKIKKILTFSQKEPFLIFLGMEPWTFQLKLEKIKKTIHHGKIYYIPEKWNSLALILKKLLTFSQKKAFLIFWETETSEKFLIF